MGADDRRSLYWLLAETGIRAGELAGLKLVNVRGNCLDVKQSVWNGKEQRLKTKNSSRTLVMSTQLQEMVREQVVKQRAKGYGFLFSLANGSPTDMNNLRQRNLKPLLEKLEIPQRGFHAFRHFNQSMFALLNVPLETREQRAGHRMTTSITQNTYTHILSDAGNEEAARKLGEAIAAEVLKAENSVALTLPGQEEPPVAITEALETAA